jgi:hypothetical protein
LIDGAINQDLVWPITSLKLAADEVLLAVADRVSTNHASGRSDRVGGTYQGGPGTAGVVAGRVRRQGAFVSYAGSEAVQKLTH